MVEGHGLDEIQKDREETESGVRVRREKGILEMGLSILTDLFRFEVFGKHTSRRS